MITVVRDLACREFLPTAWASSFSRKNVRSVVPLISALIATILVSSPVYAVSPAALIAIQSVSPSATADQAAPTPSPQTPAPPCTASAYRAFDFWIGTWDVTPAGQEKPTAVNRISAQHGGCVIREDYETAGGYTGMSMSFYDGARKIWHQTWMGADGTALFIAGGINGDGAMVLSNANWPGYVAGSPINRVTWTPNADGSVRQHWQTSSDNGASWSTVFDGLYVKRSAN